MIDWVSAGDERSVPVGFPAAILDESAPSTGAAVDPQRVAAFVKAHHGFAWRVLRRLGLSSADADDAAQRVFMIAASRFADIAPGSERAFLFRTAAHIAAKAHRASRRRAEHLTEDVHEAQSNLPPQDALLDERRARDLLDRFLSELSDDLRAVFVLFELEGMRAPEVAEALEIPLGTVASRLRRARAEISEKLARRNARAAFKGGVR